MKTIAFWGNRGGIGKTTLVYHLAWMFRRLGTSVVALDLDPQSSLTSAFLPDDRLAEIWAEEESSLTISGSVRQLLSRQGDIESPHVEIVDREPFGPEIGLVAGDLALGLFEERLAEAWPRCLDPDRGHAEDGLRVTTAFHRVARAAADKVGADVVLVDVGANPGALQRSALIASDHVVVPLVADLPSIRGLRSLGLMLRDWRAGWRARKQTEVARTVPSPAGAMEPSGYILLHPAVREDSPVHARSLWMPRLPLAYDTFVLEARDGTTGSAADPHRLGSIRHSRNLMPMAQQRRKPMFELTPADGAFGGHAAAVLDCRESFERLARSIAAASGLVLPA